MTLNHKSSSLYVQPKESMLRFGPLKDEGKIKCGLEKTPIIYCNYPQYTVVIKAATLICFPLSGGMDPING